MEESIINLSRSLGSFCNHLQISCDALKQSVDRRPIPLDSASSTFTQCLNRRVSTASADLNLLESMSFGTVSFEELLGHCNELYKTNETHLLHLQNLLKTSGYVLEAAIDEEDEFDSSMSTPMGLGPKDGVDPLSPFGGLTSVASSMMKTLEEDPLMDESLSLKNLGISDVCLATLASEGGSEIDDLDMSTWESLSEKQHCIKSPDTSAAKQLRVVEGETQGDLKPLEAVRAIEVSKDDYESLPSYLKCLTSWEDFLAAVDKINSSLTKKERTKGNNYFHQDEIGSIGLGPKARTYILLLMRMNQLVVEAIDGVISYKVLLKSQNANLPWTCN